MTRHHPYRQPQRHRIRPVATLLTVVALTTPLSSCSDTTASAPCAIVVDGSGSGVLFDAERSLKSTAVRFLTEQKCGHVVFVPLNGGSEGSVCRENPLQMQPPDVDPDQILPARRAEAVKRAQKMLACARAESDGSDIIGALRRAARQRPDGEGTYAVLVVSDMVQSAQKVSLAKDDIRTNTARQKVITALQPRIPNMSGFALFPTDLSRGASDPTVAMNITSFWHELLATSTAGNPRLDERYGQ